MTWRNRNLLKLTVIMDLTSSALRWISKGES
jgi:hypothetical protein